MGDRAELEELRRLSQLEAKAGITAPIAQKPRPDMNKQQIQQAVSESAGWGQQTPTEDFLQQMSMGTNALVGEGVSKVASFASEHIPDEVKAEFSQYMDTMMKNPINQMGLSALQKGGEIWEDFKKNNARAARNVEAAATIATAGAVGGKAVVGKWMDEALTPYMNQQMIGEMVKDGRLVGGTLQKMRFVNTPAVKMQRAALKTVPGVRPFQTNIQRRGLVNNEIARSSQVLQGRLDDLATSGKGMIPKKTVDKFLHPKAVRGRFNEGREASQYLTKKEYDTIVRDIKNRLYDGKMANGSISVGDVHKKRKLVDKGFVDAKGQRRASGALNESRDEAIWRVKRDIYNSMIDKVSPSTKAERARISTLFDVEEIFHLKAVKGAPSYGQDIKRTLPGGSGTFLRPGGSR